MQTKLHSLLESLTNIAIGLGINITAQYFIFPLFEIHIGLDQNLQIAMLFTVISLLRSYVIRRWYNKNT
jgi:hypothetical protein